ncbi:MAG: hypothetical protein WBP45_02820 [Daejeonella sp.]
MKKKILFITDSLGLPRLQPETVLYEETYIYLCKKEFLEYDFIDLCIGGGTITTLASQLLYYLAVNPDLVIVQSGIVDCAPRALGRREMALLNSNAIIGNISKVILKPFLPFLRKYRGQTSTTITAFETNIDKFLKIFNNIPVYWNLIVPATDKYEEQIPGIRKNIIQYNQIIQAKLGNNYIDNADVKDGMLMSDFHHLNKEGHANLFNKIGNIIKIARF